jgi:hypothetical protein
VLVKPDRDFRKLLKTVSHLLSSSAVRASRRPTAFAAAISTQFIVLRTTQVYPGLSLGGAFAVHCLPLPLHNSTPITSMTCNLRWLLAHLNFIRHKSALPSSLSFPICLPAFFIISGRLQFHRNLRHKYDYLPHTTFQGGSM